MQVREPLELLVEASSAVTALESELSTRSKRLESAIDVARSTSISVAKAKRLLKELQAQGAAAAAAGELTVARGESRQSACLKVRCLGTR